MKPTENPFTVDDGERHAIWEAHMRVDIDAFIAGDWKAVAQDFDAERFMAFDAHHSHDPAEWSIGFPDLAAYRDTWLRMSAETRDRADPDRLRDAMFAGARVKRIEFQNDTTAILHKVFNGSTPLKGGSEEPYGWQSVFSLRKADGRWKVCSFVGYMPHTDR
ncbi:hypothetical protein J4E08_17230 [Sagittula sp. NFXS13]|uniref:hypothetical protein n=1 Tax=Sagittula sp. NFXS13 TaxID=2819095 RepID=UPI0032DEF5DE